MRVPSATVFSGLGVLLGGFLGLSTAMAETPSHAAVTIDRIVHFQQESGEAVAVRPATYQVTRNGNTLRLIGETGEQEIVLEARPLSLEMPVVEPAVISVMRNGDEHLLVYADPNGEVVGVTGSYSGIRTREIVRLSQSLISQNVSSPMQLPGGNVLPGVPRVRSVSYSSFANQGVLVPFANANVTIVLFNLQGAAGTRIPYRLVAPGGITGQAACTMTRNPRINVGDSFQLDQNGEGRISLPGWFTSAGSCAIGIEVSLPGKAEPARLVAGPIQVQNPQRYTLSGTSNLRATLDVRVSPSLGICEGTSIGPTNFPVGVVTNGADLAFRIRSGPLGTECQFISKAWLLPDGVRLLSTKWEPVEEIPAGQAQGKCCVVNAFGRNCRTMPGDGTNFNRGAAPIITGEKGEFPSYYSVTSADRQIQEDGVTIFENQSPRIVTLVKPMWGKLQCGATLINDHGVKLVLRELILEGPPGLAFP